MRVLHVIPGIELRDGGPSRAIRAMTAALQQRGVDVTIATTHGEKDDPASDAGIVAPVVSFPRQIAPRWKISLPLAQWLWKHAGGFDLLHLHAVFCYTTLAAGAIARARQRPYIIRPLGTLDPWSLQQKSWRKRPYYDWIEKRNLSHAAALHATSESEAANLRRLRLTTPIAVVPLGLELPPAPPIRNLESPLRLLFLSRLHPKKNLPVLFQAIARLRQDQFPVTLTIAGDGPAEYCQHLQQLTETLGLQGIVAFAGWADGQRKRELFEQAHLFVLPSLQENFGIAVLEALASGLPVLVTPEVALADEVTQAQAGLSVSSSDPAAMACAIRELARPDGYASASQRARQLAERRFSINAMTDGLLSLYRTVICPRND